MKYEEIKVGESYEVSNRAEKVIAKSDEHKAVMTIDETTAICGWDESELELFQPIKKELPVGGLFVHDDGSLIFRTGDVTGFGFNSVGNYDIMTNKTKEQAGWTFTLMPSSWRIATPEEETKFNKMLEAEAEKRGLGVDAKINGHADGNDSLINNNYFRPEFTKTHAFNNHGQIFHYGTWAEPLTMLDEVCDTIKKHLSNIVVEMTDGVVTLKKL